MQVQQSNVQVMGIDAGGTMTDTFFVRADGRFVVGKAQSNPEALTQLQNWYNKADAETRKAFQIWVIQQQ